MNRLLLNRIVFLQAATVVALLMAIAFGGLYIWSTHQKLQQSLADLTPRYARLAGLMGRQADLSVMAVKAAEQLNRMAYPGSQDLTQAGNEAQQRIRALFVDSKLDIISIQVLPSKIEDGKFDRLQISLRVEGELPGIQQALLTLTTQTPSVTVDSMTLQTIGAVRPASVQRLSGQFNLSVYRVRP